MTELHHLTLAEAKKGLAEKKFSAIELTQAYLIQMEKYRGLNAYILETPDHALKAAHQTDQRIAQKEPLRLLEGMPIAIKDLFCTEGIQTTAGSKILEHFIPPYESTVSASLWKAGALMLGKANMDEFAMGSSNITSAFGPVINPWAPPGATRKFVPGGSSGGSAAAVAGNLAIAATGSDTGGSIRQPASFCGLVGIKPTYGRCSRYGMIAFASSLDQAGPLTQTVEDAALMLTAMAGHDPKDATSLSHKGEDFSSYLGKPIKGLKIGIPKEYQVPDLHPAIQDLWTQGVHWLAAEGADIREISLPHTQYALPTYYILAPAEASSNLARYDGIRYGYCAPEKDLTSLYEKTRAQGFGTEVKRRILIGTYVLSAGFYDAYYMKALKMRRLIAQDFKNAFQSVDLILTPTTPNEAFAIGEEPKDPITMYMNDVLTVPANLAGIPGISVPAGLSKGGMPLGLQLLAPALQEGRLLQVAFYLEQAANFRKQNPDRKSSS